MAADRFLDTEGLRHLWEKIKAWIPFLSRKTQSIPFGQVDSTSTATAFTATVDGIDELRDGVCCYLRNGVVTSASGCTLNINGLGAKPIYYTTASATRVTTHYNIAYTWFFVYNSTRVEGGCWDAYWGYYADSDVTGYNVRQYYHGKKPKTILYRYQFLFTCMDGLLLPVNTVNRSVATNKELTTESFDVFGEVYYYGTTTIIQPNASIGTGNLWSQAAYTLCDLRYSFNTGETLVAGNDVYLVCSPQPDGSVKLAKDPIAFALPNTEDGLLYKRLGKCYDTYRIVLEQHKPVYYYKDGAIRIWANQAVQDVSNKADKVVGATSGNFAGLDATGNLTDSGCKPSDFLTQHQHLPEYTIEKLTQAETSYSASYVLKKDNVQVGATINIPKDMVVSSGEVKTVTTANVPYQGAQVGDKYIDLTIANTAQNHIYIPVKDLVDVYVAGSGINITSNNYISVKVDQNNANGLGVGGSGVSMYVVTPSINGVGGTNGSMLATDKEKLDGIEAGAEENVIETVKVSGTALTVTDKAVNIETETAYNPTTNKIATMSDVEGATPNVGHLKTNNTSALTPSASESFTGDISLHKIAKTGSYNDLNDKPTIPSSGDFVTSLGTNGNNVTWTKNGVTNNLTVPYATKAEKDGNGNIITTRYVHYGDVLMPTNPFGGKSVYINSIDNAFAAAHRKYWVVATTHLKEINGVSYPYIDNTKAITDPDYFVDSPVVSTLGAANIFDGNYETSIQCPVGHYMKIHIQFAPFTNDWDITTAAAFGGYPYGSYYLSYYYTSIPSTRSQLRIYSKYASSLGWSLQTATLFTISSSGTSSLIEEFAQDGKYNRTCVEFIIFGEDSGSIKPNLTQIDYRLSRPNLSYNGSTVTKYGNQSLFYDFEWFKHNDDSLPEKTVSISSSNGFITANKFIKSGGTSSQFLKADGSVDNNTYATTSQLPSLPLSIENGGTGATTAKAAEYNLTPNLGTEITSEFSDTGMIPCLVSPSNTTNGRFYGYRTMLKVWNYIKSKIASVLGIGGSSGVPTAPTAAAGTNTTQIATTAFVTSATSGMAIDTNVVHKTGNETIAGVKTFTNNVKAQDADIIFETKDGDKHTVGISLDSQSFEQAEYTAGALRFSDISLNGVPVLLKNILDPIETQDAATKGYVDSEIENIQGERVRVQGWTGRHGMSPYSLVAFAKTNEGMILTSFTTTGGTGQKTPVTSYEFPIGSKIYFYNSEVSAASAGTLWELYTQFRHVDARYSAITGESISLGSSTSSSAYYYTTAVFLRVSIDGEYWKPYYKDGSTTEIIVSLDQLVSGNYYIYLGRTTAEMGDVNHRYFQLEDNNPLYYYDGTNLVDWATRLKTIIEWQSTQDMSAKADKVQNATSGNFAGLDANGNLTDSGHKHSDYLTSHQDISGKEDKTNKVTSLSSSSTDTQYPSAKVVYDQLATKQATLVSGTNIKTVNNTSLLGSGNIQINDGVGFQTITTQQDGTMQITLTNGDTITVDLNHVHPQYYSKVRETVMPQGGFLPDVVYSLGVLSSNTIFALAPNVVGNVNHYYWTFSTATTVITVTWPTRLIWANGSAPTIAANKHYEISILDNFAVYMETSIQEEE